MAFNYRYTRTLKRSNDSYKGEKACILPFFGFQYETSKSSYTQNVWINDSYSITGKRVVSGTEYDYHEHFFRKQSPKGKALELEDRFINSKKNTQSDPLKMPYIPLSLREYYANDVSFSGEYESGVGCGVGCIGSVIWLLLYTFTYPLVVRWFGETEYTSMIFVFGFPLGFCLISLAFASIVQAIRRISHGKKPGYDELTDKEKENVRNKYFTTMENIYGKEAGAILQEYAKLKRFDQF